MSRIKTLSPALLILLSAITAGAISHGRAVAQSPRAVPAPGPVPVPLEIVITANSGLTSSAAGSYCVYSVVTATGGEHEDFYPNSKICVTCPGSGSCKGKQGQRSKYRLVDGDGNTICKGDWVRFVSSPNDCIDCPEGGHSGYGFTN